MQVFEQNGFHAPRLFWYHYHSGMPMIEQQAKVRFWEEASRMELNTPPSWRGYFLCSAFVVEAIVLPDEIGTQQLMPSDAIEFDGYCAADRRPVDPAVPDLLRRDQS